MIDTDQLAFGATFLKMRHVFNLRGDKADVREAMKMYFKVLQRYPLSLVDAGADAWLLSGTRFPKPAEWLRAIPKAPGARLPVMSEEDAAGYLQAVAQCYEAPPCHCHDCRQAGVDHRFLRYVPEVDSEDRDLKMLLGDKIVVRGHWAHGDELARWYAARDAYLALKEQYPPKRMASQKVPLAKILMARSEARAAALEANPPKDEPS